MMEEKVSNVDFAKEKYQNLRSGILLAFIFRELIIEKYYIFKKDPLFPITG